ncbi:MAG: glycosyltransferase [Chitinivibrionales bacterium]|nr:glycosyltransferase [Chitinivibrionales bacterium]
MKSAIIHEWLVTVAGAESVLQSIHSLYPGDIFALFHDPEGIKNTRWQDVTVTASMLQHMPWAAKHHRIYLPLFPMAVEQFDLREYKLILSSSYAVCKGILNSSDQLHICYCHSPMRYVWDLTFEYLETAGLDKGLKSFLVRLIFHYIRMWDAISSKRVNHFIANSKYIANRIRKCYNRDATVIYPPVDVDRFRISDRRDNYFITISRLVPYKRIDLIIRAFNELELPLVIIGDGPSKKQLMKISKKNISFLGHLPSPQLDEHLRNARAFVFSAEEDFGIVNVEAQASGIPVIAYGRGGALETVVEGQTGIFFYNQNYWSIVSAIKKFLKNEDTFEPLIIRKNAEKFPRSRFEREFRAFVDNAWEQFPYK